MAEAIVADFANGLLGKLVSLAAEEVILAWNLDEDLDTLRQRLESVGALLYDAHSKNLILSAAKDWFNKLENVANVANVFMDELAYEVTRRKVENRHRKALDFFIPSKNTSLYRFKVAHKIKSLQASFDQIFKCAQDLGLQPVAYLGSTMQTRGIRSTSPYQDKALIVGRDKDVAHLVRNVCENHQEDLWVVAVKGMGGQGKTTLAHMVLKSDDVIKMFPVNIWITVSDDFDFIKIFNQMVESLTSTNLGLRNLQGLVNELQKHLKGKKFILVLDDVWNEEDVKWEDLIKSLLEIGGDKGSCILVTTRKQEVIDVMRRCVCYPVEKLSEEDSYELFKKIAFSDGGVLETPTYAALGRSMVERCGGLPLAIKALGGLLYSKSEQEWVDIKNSETWQSKDVLPSLKLSYDNLPFLSLKQCFAYCSTMPKDTVIYKDEMIQIWMALGFLQPPGRGNAEDIGNTYFNMLLCNSLLQDEERDAVGNIESCKMHDLVHDLALDPSKHHSVILNASQEVNHVRKAIYVRVDQGVTDIKPTILKRKFESVQMLYADAGAYILRDALPYLTHLTILVLKNDGKAAIELPSSLRKLKYLKYLDISCFDSRLPTYITELYNLQTLRVGKIEELPNKFCNLINLRHLYIEKRYDGKECIFNGIERLTSLQTLPHFVVSKDEKSLVGQLGGLKNLRGELTLFRLNEVENIEEARKAKLCEKSNIQQLLLDWRDKENEQEKSEESGYNNEEVMEGLEPHPNLKGLRIEYFMGKKLATWMTMMTNLVNISFEDCKRCEVVPPLGHLPKLMKMEIEGMENVKVIGRELSGGVESGSPKAVTTTTTLYPSLTELILCRMPELEEWVEGVMSRGGYDAPTVFPKLEHLYIYDCPRLRKIPISCFPSLKKLTIIDMESSMILESMILESMTTNVTLLTSLRLENIGDSISSSSTCFSSGLCSNIDSIIKNNSPSLTRLELVDLKGLKRLTLGVSLVELWVIQCPQLISINNLGEGSSPALKHLTISGIPSSVESHIQTSTLVRLDLGPFYSDEAEFAWPFSSSSSSLSNSFPNLLQLRLNGWEKVKSITLFDQLHLSPIFPALTTLYIDDFKGVKALPDSIANLPSLKYLCITNCENLESLPMFDQSHPLEYLSIHGCPIVKERYSKGSGPEWFKIQHIPRIHIR